MTAPDWENLPSLTALRAFDATSRLLSFSAAARKLNVTHAAIAQQVRALEADLGVALVYRTGRKLALTTEGERLATALGTGFAAIAAGVSAARAQRADAPLRVTMTPAFAVQWLMPRLGGFWAEHPEITVSLHPDHRIVDLREEGIDLGIRFGHGPWPGVEAEYLTSARYVVVGAPALLGGRKALTLQEMAELPWLSETGWAEHMGYLRMIGLDPETLDITEFPTEELALSAARQGYGLHLESLALIERDIESGALISVFDFRDDTLGYYIVTPPGPRRKPAQAFIKWLRSCV